MTTSSELLANVWSEGGELLLRVSYSLWLEISRVICSNGFVSLFYTPRYLTQCHFLSETLVSLSS